jgi:hypothetical protein
LGAARCSLNRLAGKQHRKMAEGAIDKMVCSNSNVKSKLPSQLAGPNACGSQRIVASDSHVEFDMTELSSFLCETVANSDICMCLLDRVLL